MEAVVEDRLKRIEIENLTIRENIWELSRRVAIVETLVRSHIVYPGNNVPIDTLLGPVPPMQRDSAAVGDLCNRLQKLESLYVQNTHNKGPIQNGPVNYNFPQPGMSCGNNRIPPVSLPVFTSVPFNQMQFIPGNIPSNTMHNPSIQNHTFGECINTQQSGDYFQKPPPPGFFTENCNKNILENLFLSGARSTTTTDMNAHPKTVDKFGQVLPIKSPVPLATPNVNIGGGVSGNPEKFKQFTPLSVELAKQAVSLPIRCTKLCGKLTGHPCEQIHDAKDSCPPCQVLLKDFKLKCGHEVSVKCSIKSSKDFKCFQCENNKIMSQSVSTAPFPAVKPKNDTFNKQPMVTQPTIPAPSAPIDDGSGSWMDVAWGDEDDFSTQSSSVTTTATTTFAPNNVTTTENNNFTSSLATKANDQKQFQGNYSSATSSKVVKDDTPLSYAQLVTQQQSSSSARNISPASSLSGVSTSSSKMVYNVEDTVKRYMKVNPQNKASRRNWINNEFKKYTKVQLYSFIRNLTHHSINLSRGTLAGCGQLLNVMIEAKFTTNELVVAAFITGIISDLPRIQKDSPKDFELIGENVCYLLVAIFEHENNLNWLVSLGHTLKETKPAMWGIISTTILDIIIHRKGEKGLKNLYQQTITPTDRDKSAVLGEVMKTLNVRV